MTCILRNDTIDSILESYRENLGGDFDQYKNHVYRVYNFALPRMKTEEEIKTLSIAAAFHDLGIWTNNTFDYLKPSIELARNYCTANGINNIVSEEIEIIIDQHHKLSRIKESRIAEIFRQADLTDLSLGLIRMGTDRKMIRIIRGTLPNKGFHLNLTRLFFKNLFVNPLNPLPMYKL